MKTRLREVVVMMALMALVAGGCSTGSKGNSGANTNAKPASTGVSVPGSVVIMGPVPHPVVAWREGLTLSKALLASGYNGRLKGARAGVVRKGQQTMYIDIGAVFEGQDVILEAGDKIEIQP